MPIYNPNNCHELGALLPAVARRETISRSALMAMGSREYELWLSRTDVSVGGSDIGTILGLNPYGSLAETYDKILGIEGSGIERNSAMKRGVRLEPIAVAEYIEETGRDVSYPGSALPCYLSLGLNRGLLRATLDGKITNLPEPSPAVCRGIGMLEVKVLGQNQMRILKASGIAPYYYAQAQLYTLVEGLDWGSFACLNAEDWELQWFDFPANEEFYEKIRTEVRRFWENHILPRVRPVDMRGRVNGSIADLMPVRLGAQGVTLNDPEWADSMNILKRAKWEKDRAENHWNEIKTRFQEAMIVLDSDDITVPNIGRVTWKESTSRSLDRERLAREHPEINMNEYMRAITTRSFRPRFFGDTESEHA